MEKRVSILTLYATFFYIVSMMFGGGYAMLPILQREIVENKKWVSDQEIADYYAIGQCTPGIIAVNTATFIGYKKRGVIGGIFATLGVISPSLLIIMTLAKIISRFENSEVVVNAFKGIRIAVVVLILNAVIKIGKSSIVDKATFGIFLCVLILAIVSNISPVVFVLIAATAGILIQSLRIRKGGKK